MIEGNAGECACATAVGQKFQNQEPSTGWLLFCPFTRKNGARTGPLEQAHDKTGNDGSNQGMRREAGACTQPDRTGKDGQDNATRPRKSILANTAGPCTSAAWKGPATRGWSWMSCFVTGAQR